MAFTTSPRLPPAGGEDALKRHFLVFAPAIKKVLRNLGELIHNHEKCFYK